MRLFLSLWISVVLNSSVFIMGYAFDHNHKSWNTILRKHVTVRDHASQFDYKGMKEGPQDLISYLKALESVSLEEFNHFSDHEKLAFLINAYNAFTVKLIIDHYPVKSIKEIGNILSTPWKIKFFTLLGEKRHLDNIEHDMIRASFNEPRIHFALVCAAVSCPSLKNSAYTPDTLDQQLEAAAVNFLADKSRNRYFPAKRKMEISPIFKWYANDFVKKQGLVEAFLAPRMTKDPKEQELIRNKRVTINYLGYDWSLNESS